MASEKVIKKGFLESCPRGSSRSSQVEAEWKRRYYVLYSSTETNKARLDWFTDETAYKESPAIRKTIFVEEITNVSNKEIPGHKNGFQVSTLRRSEPFLYSATTKQDKNEWVENLKKVMEHGRKETTSQSAPRGGESFLGDGVYSNQLWSIDEKPIEYDVTVGDTPSAVKCNLQKKSQILQIYSKCIGLATKEKKRRLLFVWPFNFIRRYGRSKAAFTFEAGRRCSSGEGVFILLTPSAEEIFLDIQKANDANQTTPPATPSVPTRSYGDHYGEIIMQNRHHADEHGPDDYTKLNSNNDWSIRNSGDNNDSPNTRQRTASASSSGSRNLPPLPPGSQAARPPPNLPPSSDPASIYSVAESVASKKPLPNAGNQEYAYSQPVTPQGSSMSAIVAQMRMTSLESEGPDDEYDKVTINIMKRTDTDMTQDTVPEAYGSLYGDVAKNVPQTRPVDNDGIYHEVSGGM